MSDIDIALADEVGKFYDDPLGFVMFAYQWGEPGTLLEGRRLRVGLPVHDLATDCWIHMGRHSADSVLPP